jgi:hypothetical protein
MSGVFQAPAEVVGSSPRVALARLALQAALAVPGVVAGDAGPHGLRVTAEPSGGFLVGVSVTAESDGRYAVDLRLVARLAPLMPLGETVRRRVHEGARRLDLADRLGTVNVEFASVIDPFEADVTSPATAATPPRPVDPATTEVTSPRSPAPPPLPEPDGEGLG